jgi:hypothetical protein
MYERSRALLDIVVGIKSITQKKKAEWIRREQKGKVNNMS